MNSESQMISRKTKRAMEHVDNITAFQVVSDFLDRNPLYPYVRRCRRGDHELKVVLYGRSPLRKAFFDIILSTAQMLDTQLHLHVIAPDAQEFWDQVKTAAPLLAQVVCIDGDYRTPDVSITGRNDRAEAVPFAHLRFSATDRLSASAMLREKIGCLFLLESCDDAAGIQLQQLAGNVRHPLLISLCRAGSIDPGDCAQNPNVVIRAIEDKDHTVPYRNTQIYRKAFGVHNFYTKKYNERENFKNIKQNFLLKKNGSYNLRSSVRSALSIPYKLHSCGMKEHEIKRFYQEILLGEDRRMLNRLIWLEHRSWQLHMILNGWTQYPNDLDEFLAQSSFSTKNNKQKWHMCLCGSDDSGSSPLKTWDRAAWDQAAPSGLDPLDRLSVQIHRSLVKKVELHKDALDAHLRDLKAHIPTAAYQKITNTVEQLRNDVTNAELGWKLLRKELAIGSELETLVQELADRNACTDYKEIDRAIIDAIPYLLLEESFRCVYSLYSTHPWNNVGVSVFLEPRELILLTDDRNDVSAEEQKRYSDFLQNRRGTNTQISVLTMDQLRRLRSNAVLDVTGATAQQLLRIQKHPLLKNLPLVACHDGGLISPDDSCPLIRYYPHNRSITVEEMMELSGATVLSENSEIPMHSMDNYKNLWKALQEISLQCRSSSYNALTEHLGKTKKAWSIPAVYQSWDTDMPEEIAVKYGLIRLLEQIKRAGLIQPYTTHRRIYPSDAALFDDLRKVLDAVEQKIRTAKENEVCSFSLRSTQGPGASGKKHWMINHINAGFSFTPPGPWVLPCTAEAAGKNGLAQLLSDLNGIGLLAPYHLHSGTQISAADPYHQSQLNQLLDVYMEAVHHGQQHNLFLNLMPENPDDLCALEDRGLDVAETNVTINKMDEGALHTCLSILANPQYGLITNLNAPGPRKPYTFSFRYRDYATKDCLTKTGNALEALTYHTIRNMNVFDDVKLGVSIRWNRQNLEGKDTQNEIDVICTKGTKSWFISCKQTFKPEKLQLNEILYEAERFGIDSIPILVTTAQHRNNPSLYARAKRMGIHIITLTKDLCHRDCPVDSVQELQTQLLAILNP